MNSHFTFVLILVAGVLWSIKAKKLTALAAVTGAFLALFIYIGTGYRGIAMMAVFFLLATLATSFRRDLKDRFGAAEGNYGQRGVGQVLANAGLAALFGASAYLFPDIEKLFSLLTAACFASAAGDTLSSELGTVYGSRFYNILSFRKDMRGKDGVISLEGILAGAAGSLVIAAVYRLGTGDQKMMLILISGISGNIVDSMLGASLEDKKLISNDVVNFVNTVAAAAICLLLYTCLPG